MTDVDPLFDRRPPSAPAFLVSESATATAAPTTHRAPRPAVRPRRRHPALGARIAAAGIGMSTMLGLVASMGIAAAADGVATDAPPSTTPLPDSSSPGGVFAEPVPAVTAPSTPVAGTPETADDPAPVTLTARPDVRVVTPQVTQAPAPGPAATTRGSR